MRSWRARLWEKMSSKASSGHVRHRGRHLPKKKTEDKYQRFRNGRHLRYQIMEISAQAYVGCSFVPLYFEQAYGDPQLNYSLFSNTSNTSNASGG